MGVQYFHLQALSHQTLFDLYINPLFKVTQLVSFHFLNKTLFLDSSKSRARKSLEIVEGGAVGRSKVPESFKGPGRKTAEIVDS